MKGESGEDYERTIHIERPIYQQEDLNVDTLYQRPHKSVFYTLREKYQCKPVECIQNTVPICRWLPNYEWRKWLLGDIIGGITVTVLQIPQGLGYALLGGVPPVTGIYMALFPVLAYAVFGTSRHISTGTFAIICLMTGKIVSQHSTHTILQNGTTVEHENFTPGDHARTNVEVAVTVTFVVAVIHLVMYLLRLGILATLFSDSLIKGLTCATSCHVVASQLKEVFGLSLGKRKGLFSIIYVIYDVFSNLSNTNICALIISIVTLIVLFSYNFVIKVKLAKYTKLPFPIELFVVIVGITFSYFTHTDLKMKVPIVGRIPTGFPDIIRPDFSLIRDILFDCFVMALVSYAVTMSMCIFAARKKMYEVDANQELLALSMSNVLGTTFSCMPTCASVSRTLIQEAVGGCTQLTSLISCLLLVFVLLWIGPLFEQLPKCCLAVIIIVAISPALLQAKMLITYYRFGKWDGLVWIVTFLVTLLIDIGYGLASGIIVALLSIFVQGYTPYTCLLGVVPNTDLYLDCSRYKAVQEVEGIKIFHYSGILNFSSRDAFKTTLVQKVGFDARTILQVKNYAEEHSLSIGLEPLYTKYVIFDFGALMFVDHAGYELLRLIQGDYKKIGIALFIVGCSGPVFETFQKCDKLAKVQEKFTLFPTIHDAVLYAQYEQKQYQNHTHD